MEESDEIFCLVKIHKDLHPGKDLFPGDTFPTWTVPPYNLSLLKKEMDNKPKLKQKIWQKNSSMRGEKQGNSLYSEENGDNYCSVKIGNCRQWVIWTEKRTQILSSHVVDG